SSGAGHRQARRLGERAPPRVAFRRSAAGRRPRPERAMSIANDAWIRRMAREQRMIEPFEEGQVAKGRISYGLSSYGYDVRLGRHFKIFHNLNSTLVAPKAFDQRSFVDHDGDECIILPNSFVLAE